MCPITSAAKKALRQSQRRRRRNLQSKEKIKKLLKEVRNLISQKKTEEAKKLLPQVYKTLDKAAKTGLIKKNAAARKKSRLAKLIQKPKN
jgi:small subunit ribosomal protein S20